MTLEDLENACLLALQEQNVNFGTQATFAAGANYSQATLDWAINRGYGKLLNDLSDISLVSETVDFASKTQVFAYPIPVAASASGTLTTTIGTGPITGVVLTTTINGTAVTYTCTATDGATSAIAALATNVNNNTTLVKTGSPVINPLQIGLNGPSFYKVSAFTPGTAGNAITFTASSSNSTAIAITASGGGTLTGGTAASPNIRTVRNVYYQPLGLTYKLLREPGVRLISWEEFQRRTASGYLQVFSAGQQPDFCAIDPPRQNLWLYPSPYTVGDTISLQYAPQLTNNTNVPATNWGYLVSSTDAPPAMLPEDAHDCIWMYALFLLWPKSREMGTLKLYLDLYKDKVKEIIANNMEPSAGASFGIRSKSDMLAVSYGSGGWYP